MAPSRTKTMKNKHAAPKGGSSKGSGGGGGGGGDGGRRSDSGGISKPKKSSKGSGGPVSKQVKDKSVSALFKKKKARTYTEAELGIPTLNMVTPVGVEKPRGKKKGKVFVDDQDSMNTILSIVQAEKTGQIESKMIKARQMEEIREARRVEAEKKEDEKKARLEDVKDSLRRKRNKKAKPDADEDGVRVKDMIAAGSKAKKKAPSSKKKVSFA